VPTVLLPRSGRLRLRGHRGRPRRAEAGRLRTPRLATKDERRKHRRPGVHGWPVLAPPALGVGGGTGAVGTSGLITGDARSLCRSFSTFEISSVPGTFGSTVRPKSARGAGFGGALGAGPTGPSSQHPGMNRSAIARLARTTRIFT